jgi:two-component system, chemotaxis family, response regulator Rcp1
MPNAIEVLLIEDNPFDIALTRQALAVGPFPIRLHVALDGEKAMQILAARHFHPDVVILDLNIPKISGLSFLENNRPYVPVVVFSSSTNPDDIQRSFQLGAKDFVPKPRNVDSYKQILSYIVRKWCLKWAVLDTRFSADSQPTEPDSPKVSRQDGADGP